jgi:chromosomal replication initiation ATPase DnaA
MQKNKELYYYAEQVQKRTGVGLRKMQSQDRHREVAEARYCLMHLMRSKMQMTLMEIAKLMRRHYSTVHHGLEVIYILQVTMNKYTWLKGIKHYEPHNIRPKDTMYICDQCGSTSNHC